jgi:hypothetical protein
MTLYPAVNNLQPSPIAVLPRELRPCLQQVFDIESFHESNDNQRCNFTQLESGGRGGRPLEAHEAHEARTAGGGLDPLLGGTQLKRGNTRVPDLRVRQFTVSELSGKGRGARVTLKVQP